MLDEFAMCWEGVEDPRSGNAALHDFHELLMIALCAVLCGGQGAVDMALFAKSKEPFLRGFLKLANGLPSHDTFSRLFRPLDPAQFGVAFQRFMAGFSEPVEGVVAIDGKVLRRSFDRASGKSPLHMVSAWGCEQRMALAQVATDALNGQREIARKIVDKGGDHALALKGKQGTLHDDVRRFLDDPECGASVSKPVIDGDHGRVERRRSPDIDTRTALIPTDIGWLQDDHEWPGLTAIGKVVRTREAAGTATTETAYYLLSTALSGERLNEVVRAHWGIESVLQTHMERSS